MKYTKISNITKKSELNEMITNTELDAIKKVVLTCQKCGQEISIKVQQKCPECKNPHWLDNNVKRRNTKKQVKQ